MGSWIGDREAVERAIRILFRFIALLGTVVLVVALNKLFGWKTDFVTFVVCGGIMGLLGHFGANGVITLIFSRGRRKKAAPAKEASKTAKRRKRKTIESFDDE